MANALAAYALSMSIAVPLDELTTRLTDYPWGYLVTVRDDGRAQSLAVPTRYVEGAFVATVGRGTASNATSRPNVTLLFPGNSGQEYSLIVDGDATVDGDRMSVRPTWAVLHRPALGPDEGAGETLTDAPNEWYRSQDDLASAGFEGFVPFSELRTAGVPDAAGVYLILRLTEAEPDFRQSSPAGRFQGKDPTVGLEALRTKWVRGTPVLYVGKASERRTGRGGLRQRLDEYRRYGAGEPVGHRGGRYIWQLSDSSELVVAWRAAGDDDAEDIEAALLAEFMTAFGRLPFANLKRGRSPRPAAARPPDPLS